MNIHLFRRKLFGVFVICLEVFCLEAAIVELPREKYEHELNELKENEKFLITSSVDPAAITTTTTTTTTTTITTITLTKISGNESSQENIIVQSSFEPSVSLFKNEETSILDSHSQLNEPISSQTISVINNISAKLEESELITPTFKEYKPANSKENSSSLPITAVSAIPFTSVYQPVIHLEKENEIEVQFFKYLSILENPFLQRLANKVLKYKDPIEELKSKSVILNEYLSNKQLRSIFKLSKHAIPSLLRCQQPESTITIKCISNAARITFVSDSETRFNAKASINRKRSTEILLDGYKLNAYLVWWTEQNKTNSELSYKLTKENLQRKCEGCKQLETIIKLESENHACLIPVLCRHPQNEVITFDASKLSAKYNVRNIPVITTSMALHELENKDGNLIVEELTSGTDVHILIQATSDVIPVGMFIRECKISSNTMHGIKLLNNGCSISNLLENFKVVVSPSDKNYKFATMAKFTSFSVKTSSQNFTLDCSIIVCDGMCDIHSSCQSNIKQHPSSTNSRIIQEIYLETTYKILPENSVKAGHHPKDIPIANVPYGGASIACLEADSDKVSREVCYVYLVLVCLMFIVLLSTIVVYFRRHKVMSKSNYEEEIESPQRTFYHYDSNTRRRSPNSSSILNFGD